MPKALSVEALLNDRKRLVKLCIEMENDFIGDEVVPRTGRMSVLFVLAITDKGNFYFFRKDISSSDRQKIIQQGPEDLVAHLDRLKQLLSAYDCDEEYWGTSYIFTTPPPPDDYPDVIVLDEGDQPVFAIQKDGQYVSKAWTWGGNGNAVEVEVETQPAYRRRGYAKQTVSAWAAWHLRNNHIAFFSHEYVNDASGRLASKLELTNFASILILYQRR